MVTEQPAGGEMKSLLPEAAVDEIKEDEPSETVVAAFEDVTGVKTEPESKIDAGGDIFVEASVSEDEGVQQIDAATVPVKDYQVPEPKIPENSEAAPNEEVSVVEETEENVPVFVPRPSVPAEEISADGREFQQTDEQPVEIVCRELTDDERDALIPTFYEFNKGAGFGQFQADEKIYNLTLSDVDFETYELENWSLIIFDDYRLRLNPEDKELVLPKADNVVRYAKLLKGGKTKLELFNETQYNFMAPTEEFVKIRGHFIYGNIANNSKLIIKDFINLTLSDKQGQLISFNKPVSGLLTGRRLPSFISATFAGFWFRQEKCTAGMTSGNRRVPYAGTAGTPATNAFLLMPALPQETLKEQINVKSFMSTSAFPIMAGIFRLTTGCL